MKGNLGERLDALGVCVQLLIMELRELQASVRHLEDELALIKSQRANQISEAEDSGDPIHKNQKYSEVPTSMNPLRP